jgi:predicted small metal-binding protein
MRSTLNCPCGTTVTGTDEDDLVDRVQEHLRSAHPDRNYSREEILLLAW